MSQPDLASLPLTAFEDVAALSARRSARWRPGLAARQGLALHNEVFASSREAAGTAAALALALDDWRCLPRDEACEAQDRRGVLWVQTREAARRTGRPYRSGLPGELQARVIHVLAEKPEDALFALEEGLRCRDLAFVVGEIAGNPKPLDFTASRRLTLASEKHGVPLFLVRIDAAHDLSSARMRWDVASAPSPYPRWNAQAPGAPRWQAELFRARAHAPGEWVLGEEQGSLTAGRARREADEAIADWTAGLRLRHPPLRA
jgi:protein ImuA